VADVVGAEDGAGVVVGAAGAAVPVVVVLVVVQAFVLAVGCVVEVVGGQWSSPSWAFPALTSCWALAWLMPSSAAMTP
jgi:cell division protein FtsX